MSYFRPDLAGSGSSPQGPETESREERQEREAGEAVRNVFTHPGSEELSNQEIARALGCDVQLVAEVRKSVMKKRGSQIVLIIMGIIMTIGLIISLYLSSR